MRRGVGNELLSICGIALVGSLATKKYRLSAALLATGAAVYLASRRNPDSFKEQSVLITGGSRGLGLALALRFAQEGARVAILARDGDELNRAVQIIHARVPGSHILPLVCDVTDKEQLTNAITETAAEFGGLDLLLNNAGAITVGPFESMEAEDFEAQVKLHLLAVVESCRIALPHLRKSVGRRIVNICSMGGRVAVPHMLPYDASKFALSGFSQGLMAELSRENISVTTIYPALMRTGSPIQAVFKGDHKREFAWFAAADVLPGLSLAANEAADKIVEAARLRAAELMPSIPAKARMVAAAFFPETLASVMGFIGRLMPRGKSTEHYTGAESRERFDKMWLTAPLRKRAKAVEEEWNQNPKHDAEYNMGLRGIEA